MTTLCPSLHLVVVSSRVYPRLLNVFLACSVSHSVFLDLLSTAAEILRVWCEDLVKSMQELCSLGMPLCINLTSAVSLQHAPSIALGISK